VLLGSIGPVTQMTQFSNSIGRLSSVQQGIYVACILLASSLSSLASGYISDRISRKYGIVLSGILTMIGTITSASSPNFASLIVARLVTGTGLGQGISVTTVYLVEIASPEVRGVSACFLQLYIVIGVMAGYFISYGSHNIHGGMAWRLPFIVQSIIAVLLCVGMFFLPFSPRWLAKATRDDDARQTLRQLRRPSQVEPEFDEIKQSLSTDIQEANVNLSDIFARRYIRRTLLGIFIMVFQQMTGVRQPFPITILNYYLFFFVPSRSELTSFIFPSD
jgi:MFS family permease